MKRFFLSLLLFFIWSFFGLWWYYSCSFCGQNTNENTTNTTPPTPVTNTNLENDTPSVKKPLLPTPKINSKTIVLDSKQAIAFEFNEKIGIKKDSDSLLFPQKTTLQDAIYNYLNSHIDEELVLVSWHHENEATTNLGTTRGNHLKSFFVNNGINPDRITVKDSMGDFKFNASGIFYDGFNFYFKKLSNERLATVNKGIEHKTLYTRFNSRNFKPDNTMNAYLEELKSYLQKYPNKKVTIVGHTDDVGDEKVNIVIARDRARNVMRYFAKNGIAKEAMTAISKGESEPVADNTTDEGRSKNRRIEIIIN